jgi:glycerol-3-phosphate cytidylyltransferase
MKHVKKYRIGLTFGAFCPLHYGHINLFINAKEHCDKLIVCMSSDEYIKSKKGYEPPVPFEQRFMHLSALRNELISAKPFH